MKRFLLPDGADTLLAFAEAIARELAEKHEELGIHLEVEARFARRHRGSNVCDQEISQFFRPRRGHEWR